MKVFTLKKLTMAVLVSSVAGCATNIERYQVPDAKIAKDDTVRAVQSDEVADLNNGATVSNFRQLNPLTTTTNQLAVKQDLSAAFTDSGALTLSLDATPGKNFIHTVFGEQLAVNYVLAEDLTGLEKPVSLNVQDAISPRRLFLLTQQLLSERGIDITLRDGVYFIHPKNPEQQTGTLGYGRSISSVPSVNGTINQLVPMIYQKNFVFAQTIATLSGADVRELQGQSAFYVAGQRDAVVKALEAIQLLDAPLARGRHIGLQELTYITLEDFTTQLGELLASEGLSADIGKAGERNMVIVPLPQIGSLAIFAANQLYLERVQYWANQLDKPNLSSDKEFYVYYPRFARASDLGSSIAALFGQQSSSDRSRDTNSAFTAQQQVAAQPAENSSTMSQPTSRSANAAEASVSINNEEMTMTVDQRSNTIIFHTTGKKYQSLLPMMRRLDVMPKQILLEATIAEVKLTDEFKMGLEFAIKNGNFGISTSGATRAIGIAGASISYIDGLDNVLAKLSASNSNINVLSNPSIVVRDGVSANITVGDDVPTVGSTTTNPNFESQTQTVVYRKTGNSLTVTPTISAQGLVVMQISQTSSNVAPSGPQVSGSPTIFERSISTEVIAQSGQTIMLGGVISENSSKTYSKVPFLADLPGLGVLFRSEEDVKVKNELVILITPKVIDSADQWQKVRQDLANSLQLLALPAGNVGKTTEE